MVSLRPLPSYPARTEGIRSFHHQKASPEILAPTRCGPSPPHHNGRLEPSRGKLNQLPQDWEVGTDPSHPWRHCWDGNKSTLLLCSLPQGLCFSLWRGTSCSLVHQVHLEKEKPPLLCSSSTMDSAGISSNTHILVQAHFCKLLF